MKRTNFGRRWQAVGAIVLLVTSVHADPAAVEATGDEDEQTLATAGLKTDTASLLAFFRGRARDEIGAEQAAALLRQFAATDPSVRAEATAQLIALGPLAVPALRRAAQALDDFDLAQRARNCLQTLEGPQHEAVPTAAARLLAARKPAGAAEVLLAYVPYADSDEVGHEVLMALAAVAYPQGQPEPVLLKALADPVPARRAAAGAALCRADQPRQWEVVRPLLHDPKPGVRMRVGLALAEVRDVTALPVLIELLAELPAEPRRGVEDFLQGLAGDWAPTVKTNSEDPIGRRIRRDAWAGWLKNTEGPALLALLRDRTLTAAETEKARALIVQLGDERFEQREKAAVEVVALGPRVLPLVRGALHSADPEVTRRATRCIQQIDRDGSKRLPVASLRLLALRRPPGALEALLAFLPFAEDETILAEAQQALVLLAMKDGQPDPALLAALDHPEAAIRGAAAEALAQTGGAEQRTAAGKLLHDRDLAVRLRVALALARAGEREAVPVLIDMLAVLPTDQAGPAYDYLLQLAEDKPPKAPPATNAATAKKARDAWAAWWQENGAKTTLVKLDGPQHWLGFTLIVEGNPANGRVFELGRDNKPRWSIEGLMYPVDAVVLPNNRVLIAELNGQRVTERDLKGNIVWKKDGLGSQPINVQRLPNGHTFIGTDSGVLEVDRDGKTVFSDNSHGPLAAAYKARNGHIICLTQMGQCLRLDAAAKQLKSFPSHRDNGWIGGMDLLPNGRILISQPNRGKIAEFDPDGKTLLEVEAPQVMTASGLPNGHILAATANRRKAIEYDRKGKTVWEYQGNMPIFRARRR
jgi:HEAT repeat protein